MKGSWRSPCSSLVSSSNEARSLVKPRAARSRSLAPRRSRSGWSPLGQAFGQSLGNVALGWLLFQGLVLAGPAAAQSPAPAKPSAAAQTSPAVQASPAATATLQPVPARDRSSAPATPVSPPGQATPAEAQLRSPSPQSTVPATQELPVEVPQESPATTEIPASPRSPLATTPRARNVVSYGQLLRDIDAGKVAEIRLRQELPRNTVRVIYKNQASGQPVEVDTFSDNPELIERIKANNVSLKVEPSTNNQAVLNQLWNLLFLVIVIAVLIAIIRRSAGAANQAMNFGKSRARFQMEAKTGVLFEDVAGIEEAKEELQEVVTFLKKSEKFTAIGAKIPKGVLLIGSPGTGKTLLAKAIAGEAAVPFFSISGSEFVEMFVGVGASRVRDLFRKAKENSPCIIFIDEIDAVGRQRGAGIGGGNDEREQTLNQLLTEMDGFEDNTGVIVIAATNRPDVLDTALLRPGRFDRQITVDLPSYKGRLGILDVHARNKKLSSDVSLEAIARRTPGFSGADLANLLNEAAILTARRLKEAITPQEVDDAIDRITIGMTLKPLLDGKKKRLIAYHEIGHALLMTLLKHSEALDKVTIIPRSGGIGGFAKTVPNEEMIDSGLYTRASFLDRMIVTMGGRAAEEIIFGQDEVTVGATGDIQSLTSLARRMVTRYGMSDLGPVALEGEGSEIFLGRDWMAPRSEYSENMAIKVDRQIRQLATHAHAEALRILGEHRELMDVLVDRLLEQETIDGEDFRRIVSQYAEVPEKSATPKRETAPV